MNPIIKKDANNKPGYISPDIDADKTAPDTDADATNLNGVNLQFEKNIIQPNNTGIESPNNSDEKFT